MKIFRNSIYTHEHYDQLTNHSGYITLDPLESSGYLIYLIDDATIDIADLYQKYDTKLYQIENKLLQINLIVVSQKDNIKLTFINKKILIHNSINLEDNSIIINKYNETHFTLISYDCGLMWTCLVSNSFSPVPLKSIPNTPEILSHVLVPSNFIDTDNKIRITSSTPTFNLDIEDTHISTDWELSKDSDFDRILYQSYDNIWDKTNIEFDNIKLDTDYYIRCKYNFKNQLDIFNNNFSEIYTVKLDSTYLNNLNFGTSLTTNLKLGTSSAINGRNIGMTAAQAKTYYSSNSNLNSKVTIIGNGFQSYTIPYSGVYEIEVCGASGGFLGACNLTNNIPPSNKVYGGRPALLKGQYYFEEDQVIYLLIGQVGRTQATNASGGGGGGGASMIFIEDPDSEFIFVPKSNLPVRPLIVAGGGAGRHDANAVAEIDDISDVADDDCPLNAKYKFNPDNTDDGNVNPVNTKGLAAFGLVSILKGTNRGTSNYPGGWGGGGFAYNGGGAGAGYSGGYCSDDWIDVSQGGTSYMDISVKEISRGLLPFNIGDSPINGYINLKYIYNDIS